MSSETTSARSRPIEELEAAILETLEPYFEAYRQEAQESKGRVEAGFRTYKEAHEEARQQLAKAETELEQIGERTEEIRAKALNAVVEGDEASELEKDVSELQAEVRDLAEAEKAAQRGAQGGCRRAARAVSELEFEGHPGEAADMVAAYALHKVEEIDAFKSRLEQRFLEGRTSVIKGAS
jgi:chromosome segregation ATPase